MLSRRKTEMLEDHSAEISPAVDEPDSPAEPASLGQLGTVSLACAVGFVLVAAAHYASRRQLPWAEPAYWIGVAVLFGAPMIRLVGTWPSRAERVGLLCVLAVGLYLVKVSYSPDAFTNPDELSHQFNLLRILETGRLFFPNPVVIVTHLYPGLVSVTAAVASMSGLTDFQSALLVIGATRVLLMLVLFLLVEHLTESPRVAGLAAALYAANPTYLFYSSEFGYEGLALPLGGLVLLAAVRRERDRAVPALRAGWTVFALLIIAAVAATHHLTAYALVAALWGIVIVALITRRRARPAPWDLAAFASLVVGGWFVLVAGPTGSYLSSTLGIGLQSLVRLLTLQQLPRQLFDPSSSFGVAATLWQVLLAFASVLLIAIGLALGVRPWWQRSRLQSIGICLGLAGLGYVPLQILRLTPASWETAHRSSGFVFAGVGLILALVLVGARARQSTKVKSWLQSFGLLAYALVIFLGGVVLSWRSDVRLPRPYYTQAQGHVMEPQGIALATWSRQLLGVNNSVAANDADAFLLATYGQQRTWTGFANGIRGMLLAPEVNASVRLILSGVRAEYVVLDRRLPSLDILAGYYPAPGPEPLAPHQLMDPVVSAKFDSQPDVSRIADTGDIVVYDVSRLSGVAAASTNN